MIEGKDKKWHNRKTIEMWEEIAEKNLDDKRFADLIQEYNPVCGCFLCEWHENCFSCPFKIEFNMRDEFGNYGCLYKDSPYAKWFYNPTKYYAEKMVEWLKEHLEV